MIIDWLLELTLFILEIPERVRRNRRRRRRRKKKEMQKKFRESFEKQKK